MDNAKRTFYVSVRNNLFQKEPDESTEFTVQVNEEEEKKLRDQLIEMGKEEKYTFKRAFVPYKSADHDDATNQFDNQMIELYTTIYELGDETTRQTIKEMKVLPKLHDTNYDHKGYDDSSLTK